jgi:porphobilinogen synthase
MNMDKRPRRLRVSDNMRRLVRETKVTVDDLIYPMFVVEGKGIKKEIASMPGVYHFSIDEFIKELEEVQKLNIPGVLLFGVPENKDETGSGAYADDGIVQLAIQAAKERYPELLLVADVCLCEYTSHGHCGIVENGKILNDCSVELIVKAAVSYARSGADIIAPSDMMDGRIGAIRKALDEKGFIDKAIMSYSAKYSSAFYGPFREAAHSTPSFGDRKTYQMDFANKREAVREVELDIEEGADIVMVKPALAYLDILSEIKTRFNLPVAAYNVSGEYSMIKAAAKNSWIDEKKAVMESVTSIKRAGADIIITYFAKDIALWLKEGLA